MPTFSREDRIEMGVISTSWGWLLLLLHVTCDSPCLHRTSWSRTACLTPTCVFGTDVHATHPCGLCREFDQQLLQHRPQELYGPGAEDHHVLLGQPNKRFVWLPSTTPRHPCGTARCIAHCRLVAIRIRLTHGVPSAALWLRVRGRSPQSTSKASWCVRCTATTRLRCC